MFRALRRCWAGRVMKFGCLMSTIGCIYDLTLSDGLTGLVVASVAFFEATLFRCRTACLFKVGVRVQVWNEGLATPHSNRRAKRCDIITSIAPDGEFILVLQTLRRGLQEYPRPA